MSNTTTTITSKPQPTQPTNTIKMQFTTSIIALALAASSAMASDVYATFYNSEGQIAPNFDVSNPGCFTADSAVQVSFNQHANGPYCLSAFAQGGCPGSPNAKETFESLSAGTIYGLDSDVQYAGSMKWALGAC